METFKTSAWPIPRRRDSGRKGSLGSYLKILGRTFIERHNNVHTYGLIVQSVEQPKGGCVAGSSPAKAIRYRILYKF